MRRIRKGSLTSLKRKADALVSKIVRSKGKCEWCGGTNCLQAAHIVGRNNHAMRFDLLNLLCLCAGCHRKAHDNPLVFTDWVEHAFPARYEYLLHNKNALIKRTAQDYQDIIAYLTDLSNPKT